MVITKHYPSVMIVYTEVDNGGRKSERGNGLNGIDSSPRAVKITVSTGIVHSRLSVKTLVCDLWGSGEVGESRQSVKLLPFGLVCSNPTFPTNTGVW